MLFSKVNDIVKKVDDFLFFGVGIVKHLLITQGAAKANCWVFYLVHNWLFFFPIITFPVPKLHELYSLTVEESNTYTNFGSKLRVLNSRFGGLYDGVENARFPHKGSDFNGDYYLNNIPPLPHVNIVADDKINDAFSHDLRTFDVFIVNFPFYRELYSTYVANSCWFCAIKSKMRVYVSFTARTSQRTINSKCVNLLWSKRRDPCTVGEVPFFWISHHHCWSGSDEVGSSIIIVFRSEKGISRGKSKRTLAIGGFVVLVDLISFMDDRTDRLFVLAEVSILEGGWLGVGFFMVGLILLCILLEVGFLYNSMCHSNLFSNTYLYIMK